MLTDLVEIHFIELPKFRSLKNKNYKDEALQRWLTFLEKDISKEVLEELMEMEPAIKMAEEKLDFLSSDPETIELYKAREYSAHERANLLSTGIEKGRIEGREEVAQNLLKMGMQIELVAEGTGLSKEKVKEIQEKMHKSPKS